MSDDAAELREKDAEIAKLKAELAAAREKIEALDIGERRMFDCAKAWEEAAEQAAERLAAYKQVMSEEDIRIADAILAQAEVKK